MSDTWAVRHSFNAGDIIYSMWAVKAMCEKLGKKAIYYQQLNRPVFHKEGHPTMTREFQQVTFNQAMFDMMRPLILRLDFIEDFRVWRGEQSISLDRVREIASPMPYGDIRRWYGYAYPDMQVDIGDELYFDFDDRSRQIEKEVHDKIVVNRTARYRNPQINYAFLNRTDKDILFVGALEEYDDFQQWVPKAKYRHVQDFLELAMIINWCKLFIGNQSFCFSLAEAQKTPRLLEVSVEYPNVIVAGPDGYDFFDNQAFEMLVQSLLK